MRFLGSSNGFIGFGIATTVTVALGQHQHEVRIISGKMESGPEAFPSFNCWRALVNCSKVKSPEMLFPIGAGILQRSDTSLATGRADS